MALGKSSINSVRNYLENISNDIKYGDYSTNTESIYSCYNTFQYVANNLKEWADDTTIGGETKQNLLKLSDLLSQLIEETKMLESKVNNFCDSQDKINGVNYVNNITKSNYDRSKGYKAGDLSNLP